VERHNAPAPESIEDIEAQFIEDFEYPICDLCLGAGMIRDPEFGIRLFLAHQVGAALGAAIAGWVFEWSGTYPWRSSPLS
jgi:hypothetical protein